MARSGKVKSRLRPEPLLLLSIFLLCLLASGCYTSSSGRSNPDGREDVSGLDTVPPDTGIETISEIMDPDADALPDALPWDAVDADLPEYDLPEIGEDAPAAEPVGPPVVLDDETHAGGPPAVAWNGSGWGVVWGDMMTPIVFRSLDAMAEPLGPPVIIDPSLNYFYTQIEWHVDHYGLAGSYHSDRDYRVGFITIDEQGAPLSGVTWVAYDAEKPDLAWSQQAGGWLVSYILEEEETIFAALLSDRAELLGEPLVVASGETTCGPRVVGLKSRNAFFWYGHGAVWHRSFQWPDVSEGTEATQIMPMTGISDTYIEAAAYLDWAFVAGMDGHNVLAVVVEPWTGSVLSGPNVIGQSEIEDRQPGIAAVTGRGYLGVCYETGPGPWGGAMGSDDGVSFRIIDTAARPLGAPLVVASDLENIGGCAVGWSGSEFIVIYWSCGGDSAFNQILAQRVRPLI